eukprot:501015-Rhodomonas_salina.1
MFLAVLLLAFGGAQVGSADHGGVSLADQAKLVFEADYFTAGTEPSLQLVRWSAFAVMCPLVFKTSPRFRRQRSGNPA